jgi:hypothetical protein
VRYDELALILLKEVQPQQQRIGRQHARNAGSGCPARGAQGTVVAYEQLRFLQQELAVLRAALPETHPMDEFVVQR